MAKNDRQIEQISIQALIPYARNSRTHSDAQVAQIAASNGFYVYQLIDPRTAEVFYIGKGKGGRVSQHSKNARRGIVCNAEKHRRICDIHKSGLDVIEVICKTFESEDEAFTFEREMIASMKYCGITNIVGGVVTNRLSNIEKAKHAMSKVKEFHVYEATVSDRVRAAVIAGHGSLRAFYDEHVGFFKSIIESEGAHV